MEQTDQAWCCLNCVGSCSNLCRDFCGDLPCKGGGFLGQDGKVYEGYIAELSVSQNSWEPGNDACYGGQGAEIGITFTINTVENTIKIDGVSNYIANQCCNDPDTDETPRCTGPTPMITSPTPPPLKILNNTFEACGFKLDYDYGDEYFHLNGKGKFQLINPLQLFDEYGNPINEGSDGDPISPSCEAPVFNYKAAPKCYYYYGGKSVPSFCTPSYD